MNPELNNNTLKYIEDKSFVKWVNSGFTFDNDKWQPLHIDVKTQEHISEAIDMVGMLQFDIPQVSNNKKRDLFDRINASTQTEETPVVNINKKSGRKTRILVLGIAATFLLLLFALWPSASLMKIQTDFAEMENVNLPDNSTVVVNAKSQLTFDKSTFAEKRNLQLNGEAFFKVEKGSSFQVETDLGKIEVLGTSFNVFARENKFEVVCETGKVRVSLNGNIASVILSPGEKCYLEKKKLQKQKRNKKSNQWIDGLYHFEGDELKEVIAEMERQFNVSFETSDIDLTELYSGFFSKLSLDKALESVFWTLGIEFEKSQDNKVIVLKK